MNFIAIAAPAVLLLGTAAAAPLNVTLEGVESREGPLYVSAQTEAQFLKQEAVAGDIIEAPEAGTAEVTLDVPPGTYAVMVWHDDNANQVFDMGEAGIPLDGWAMSSGTEMDGPPTFEEAGVEVTDEGGEADLTMTYGR